MNGGAKFALALLDGAYEDAVGAGTADDVLLTVQVVTHALELMTAFGLTEEDVRAISPLLAAAVGQALELANPA